MYFHSLDAPMPWTRSPPLHATVHNLYQGFPGSQPGVHVPLGVHLRLEIEGKNTFTCCLFSNIYT